MTSISLKLRFTILLLPLILLVSCIHNVPSLPEGNHIIFANKRCSVFTEEIRRELIWNNEEEIQAYMEELALLWDHVRDIVGMNNSDLPRREIFSRSGQNFFNGDMRVWAILYIEETCREHKRDITLEIVFEIIFANLINSVKTDQKYLARN